MSSVPKTRLTPEQYLAIERQAEIKSEYFDGEMFAMSGASREHNLIGVNAGTSLNEGGPTSSERIKLRARLGHCRLRNSCTTKSPIERPAARPAELSNSKWMPPRIRLRPASFAASAKLVKERVTISESASGR